MRLLLLLFAFSALSASSAVLTSASAAEPQWIWRHQDAATKAEQETVYFRRVFDVETPDGGFIEITADNRCEVYLNGRRVGSGDDWRQRFKFDIGPLLLPGRNLIAVSATNADADSAGLVVHLLAKDKGKAPVEVFSDASWKWSTKVPGTWTRLESDDSQWDQSVELGAYGQTAPWGAAGQIVEGKPAFVIPSKPRSREKGLFEFRDGDRVVFLGSAFIERLQNTGYLETMITAAFPRKKITFRNLGWSGDNVWGDARAGFGTRAEGFQRLVSDVTLCDPTVLIVCYGENEAHAGEEGLEDFRVGLNTLLDVLERTGARIVLLAPRKHWYVDLRLPFPTKYNADLRKYNDVIGQVAKEREHWFVNLFNVLPQTDISGKEFGEDGFRLTALGDYVLSGYLAAQLRVPKLHRTVRIDFGGKKVAGVDAAIDDSSFDDGRVSASVQFEALFPTPPEPIMARRDFPLSAMAEVRIVNVTKGKYRFQIDKTAASEFDFESDESTGAVVEPVDARAESLRELINEKNTLFFHRYRPQNETYLFLFRKHEQGNNAVEIPQFDPLIDELEKKIDELKQPVKQKFELIKVK